MCDFEEEAPCHAELLMYMHTISEQFLDVADKQSVCLEALAATLERQQALIDALQAYIFNSEVTEEIPECKC